MASLTHVCMWSKNGWRHISAEEASKLHTGGTVSAHSGLFMCELCGQYVILTDGDIRVRYFKHSAYEKSKNCPERTFGAAYSISYRANEHDLPIRIVPTATSSFRFELGLIRAPINSLGKDFRVVIKAVGSAEVSYEFAKERLQGEGITYLPIGERPFEKYRLSFKNGIDKLHEFWPTEVNGVDSTGTLFDKLSGKKIVHDADVEVGKEYYLLKRGHLYSRGSHGDIRIQHIVQKSFGFETWNLYVVSVLSFSEEAARFYLDYHCRLTEHPVAIQPVWPLFVEGPYVIKHNKNSMCLLIDGNVSSVKAFPSTTVQQLSRVAIQKNLYRIYCSSRQQLISAGRTQSLQYTYYWREPLNQEGDIPSVSVTYLTGAAVVQGKLTVLPPSRALRILAEYDGEVCITQNARVVEKRPVPADKYIELDSLTYGMGIQIHIGLDCIWSAQLERPFKAAQNERELLNSINEASSVTIPVPHALRNILICMREYPQISQWIRKRIRAGIINERAYRILQDAYRNRNIDREGDTL